MFLIIDIYTLSNSGERF